MPIGAIIAYSSNCPPLGWLVCDGREYLIENFPNLYEVIGTTFGGTENISFRVPDLEGQFIRGWDKLGNIDPEREFGSPQDDSFQGHSHDMIIDSKKIHISTSGEHSHKIGKDDKYTTYERNFIHTEYQHYHLSDYQGQQHKVSETTGKHTHDVALDTGAIEIRNAVNSSDGIIRKAIETRPKNVALLYCIKAENLPSPQEIEKNYSYSTIIEKAKTAAMPLCELLSIEKMGSARYTANIEQIKQSYFLSISKSKDPSDINYLIAKCFKDICIYNCRIGLRNKEFDEYGLHLLVGWFAEKGLIKTKEMQSVKEDVKNLLICMQSICLPK